MAILVSQLACLLHGTQLFHTPNQLMKSQIANWIIDDKKKPYGTFIGLQPIGLIIANRIIAKILQYETNEKQIGNWQKITPYR